MAPKLRALCVEFCRKSSLHGVQYLTGSSVERVVWSVLLLTITSFLVWLVYDLWEKVFKGVVMVVVENPHVELTLVEYPAVTVCPNNKVLRKKVQAIAERYVNTEEEKAAFENSIIALSLSRFPFYNMPQDYADVGNRSFLHIPNKDIVDIMKAVGPDVDDVFARCKWRSPYYDCNNLFRRQITEEGFCFSFNSKTAERSEDDPPDKPPLMTPDGSLVGVRTNMFGRRSGLGFRVKSLAGKALDNILGDGYSVIVHNPKVPPDLTTSMTVPADNPYKTFEVAITVKIVQADKSLHHLDEKVRDCVFDNGTKGLDGCMSACRMDTLLELCRCVPYHRSQFRPGATVCGTEHFECLRDVNLRLRSARVTRGTPGFPSWTTPVTMDCSCLQSCTYTHYSGEYEAIPLVVSKKEKGWTRIRVIYKNHAVKYTRTAKYVVRDLVVGCGGVAGVLLGFSIVAILDCIIFVFKFAFIFMTEVLNCPVPGMKRSLKNKRSGNVRDLEPAYKNITTRDERELRNRNDEFWELSKKNQRWSPASHNQAGMPIRPFLN